MRLGERNDEKRGATQLLVYWASFELRRLGLINDTPKRKQNLLLLLR